MERSYRPSTLPECLLKLADSAGDRPALVVPARLMAGESLNWQQLAAIVFNLGQIFRDRGLPRRPQSPTQPGVERQGLEQQGLAHGVRNNVEDVLTALACYAVGILEFPIDLFGGDAYVKACRSVACDNAHEKVTVDWLSDEEKADCIRQAINGMHDSEGMAIHAESLPSADDEAIVLWTSGTSGTPKGVVLTHGSLCANAKAKLTALPQSMMDRRLTVLSIAHAYARTCDVGTWLLSGCCLALGRGFEAWREHASSFQPTLCNCVPSLSRRILENNFHSPALFALGCGGAAMPESDFLEWRDRGVHVIQGYGLTESGPVIASQSPGESIAEHVGRPVPGWECDWVNERLRVRGPHLFQRYWHDSPGTNIHLDSDGWLDTGDLVRVNPEHGQWQILGRADDRITLSNGHNVDPAGLEQRVTSLPGVEFCFADAATDGRRIELYVQWIESTRTANSAAEKAPAVRQLITSLPDWEKPKRVHTMEVPRELYPELFNRKGAVKRTAMKRFLATTVPGSAGASGGGMMK